MVMPSCLPRGWLGDEEFPVAPECSCGLTGAPFEFHGADCDRAVHPHLDDETLALVDAAVESLACLRGSVSSDAGAALSCLASLVAEAQSRLPDAVAAARDQDYTWSEIAARLATTASAARRRYGDYVRWVADLPVPGD
jgi:hypothetical protein